MPVIQPPPPPVPSLGLTTPLFRQPGDESWVWLPPGIPFPNPLRAGIVAPLALVPAPPEDLVPWVMRRGLPSPGTPAPAAIGPPGRPQVATALAADEPALAWRPAGLPSVGTPALHQLGPPGHPLSAIGLAEEPPGRASLPCLPPAPGTPSAGGVGLVTPPLRAIIGVPADEHGVGPWSGGAMALGLPAMGVTGATGQGSLGLLACCCCPTKICVTACGSIPVVGATINILLAGTIVATCLTDPTGCCAFALAGSFVVQVIVSGTIVFSATRTLNCTTITIALGTPAGLVCCGGYAIPQILTLTDVVGTIAFVYDPNTFFPTWYNGHSVTQESCSVTTPNNICVAAPPSPGPVRVCYQMICFAGQNPTFAIQRSWSWVFEPGTLTPIWYQDPSGFIAGQPCTTGPPAMCGSPHTDVSTDSENPTSTAPFTITFHPVPAISNYTGDPIGGDVVITP